jgi:hypothetical protein
MNFKHLITAASVALLPLTAGAATLIIPAAASTTGAFGSVWKSEVTLHSSATHAIEATLTFHDQTGPAQTATISVPARQTVLLADVVRTKFNRESSLGAIEINVADADINRLAVTSRTSNILGSSEFGQDIPAILSTDSVGTGDAAVISGPSSAANFRFNAGLYTLAATTVRWDVIHADGTAGGTQTIDYAAGVQNQYSVASLVNTTLQDNDVLVATVLKGSAIFYGSVINQASGDPSFVPGIRTRAQSNVTLLGVDRDENGSVDIPAHDNILDRTVDVTTFGFPAFFRIVSDQPVTYEIISSTAFAQMVDDNGTVQMIPGANLSGSTGALVVRATAADGSSTVFTIPVKFL